MSDPIDEIIEKAIGVTDEDRENGHSLSVYEEEGQHFYVPDLRAVCEAGIKAGERKLARELLEGRDNIAAHGVDIPEANGWLVSKLREIAEEK